MSQREDEPGGAHHWYEIAAACVRNGRGLLADAELLLQHDRAPRALALAVLATEEFGKALQAFAVLLSRGDASEIAKFRRFGRHHGYKLEAAETLIAVADANLRLDESHTERLIVEVDRRGNRKMAGLYVDDSADGILQPHDIDLAEATEYVEFARTIDRLLAMYSLPNLSDAEVEYLWAAGPVVADLVTQASSGANTIEDLLQGLSSAFETADVPAPPFAPLPEAT